MTDPLNAFTHSDPEARGGAGVLAGVTIGIKANIAVRDMPFHAGIGAWEGRIAEHDAETVARLRAEGAVITGILNMEEGALGAKTDNPHYGAVQNPHRIGYSPGGSSGGSGAAVAAGLCDAALGTDTMGSIRIPASHCGIYGFKPANDRVSQQGLEIAERSLDCIGPLARDLDMLERVSRAMSDSGEGTVEGAGAVLVDHEVTIAPEVLQAFGNAMDMLDETPARNALGNPNSRIRFAGFIATSRAMSEHLAGVPVSDHLAKLLSYGPRRDAEKWEQDRKVLDDTREQVRDIVSRHGFLIMPTVPNPPFPHSEPEPAAQADFTCLANIAGLPAISLPMGWTDDDLPLGVQILGAAGHEAGLFALARHLDAKLGAYRPPPK